MELNNQLLGIREKDVKLDTFEWRGRNTEARQVELPERLPLETNCRYSATKLITDDGCEGCTAAHRGICLIHNDAAEHRQVKKIIPDKKANELMVNLVLQILQGRCYRDLKQYL